MALDIETFSSTSGPSALFKAIGHPAAAAPARAMIADLVAAETLMNEVRQGIGLMLLQPTEERAAGDRRPRGRRGRGPR